MASQSRLTDEDVYLFRQGRQFRLYQKLGAHPDAEGTAFGVWAPHASAVAVAGDFNGWEAGRHPLEQRADTGIWEGWVEGARPGHRYKYRISGPGGSEVPDKADPLAFGTETPPLSASVITELGHDWGDSQWMQDRHLRNAGSAPWSIYEVHVGSWARVADESGRSLSYRELAHQLAAHVERLGFTHVELLPIMEHPFYGSWGYQTLGYFAPTSRFGSPEDLMYLVDYLHGRGIGVILDWVPSHFPTDGHGLGRFDGTPIYEHPDWRRGFHPDWKSYIFDYGRPEVRSFLISSALFWLDRYHVDALRVDAVASMLYLDYSRHAGEWEPNQYGGREHLEAVDFIRQLNTAVYQEYPDVQTMAEESTAWPMVSRPVYVGGLGFGMKWDMGWMHDTLEYIQRDPVHRRWHHGELTFRAVYMFTENFVLPLSHDEVVYGKGSLLGKMPGNRWDQLANLRLLYGYMYGSPGKKLLFMGAEVGQEGEWSHEGSVEWHLAERPDHGGVTRWLADLNRLHRSEPALHELDFEPRGFEWVDANDSDQSVLTFLRRAGDRVVLVACNFTPVPREHYRVGVPEGGFWRELLNGDAADYGGSGRGNLGGVEADAVPYHGRPFSLDLHLPPLAAVFLRPDRPDRRPGELGLATSRGQQ
ncbi:MAG: 1,4-alpha-glucan branching protein GlgB [Candidatus Dormibacteraeota bacterium]|nr:1,4-alpha-glucan branching protein GlgB [Candidatus Dormibacteraeota bacterium]MBO0760967.1 1,4-alpha-glucan branching protein GlgB [Candidatus Dormibacteraeota bacterium]